MSTCRCGCGRTYCERTGVWYGKWWFASAECRAKMVRSKLTRTVEQAEQPIDIEAGKEGLPDSEAKRIGRLFVAKPESKPVVFDWLSLPLIPRAEYLQATGRN